MLISFFESIYLGASLVGATQISTKGSSVGLQMQFSRRDAVHGLFWLSHGARCCFILKTEPLGVQLNSWTGLCCKS
jgi:hypothetical protein